MKSAASIHIASAVLAVLAVLASSGAFAAEEESIPAPGRADGVELAEVVVTGSRIARPELERLQPTQVITSDFMDKRSYTNVIDALNELPAFGEPASSLVGGQSSVGIGQSFANFFSLGSQRTLTLVDGRRFVPANSPSIFTATGNGGEQVDLDVIPTMLLERVETIAVGGAPIYGSDAIAGTVNILLKHNFEGLNGDVLGGLSGHADAGQKRLRLLAGRNFANSRGNIEISAEIANNSALFNSDRRVFAADNAYNQNLNPSPYAYTLYPNQRLGSVSTAGVPMVADSYLNFVPNVGIYNSAGALRSFNQGALAPYTLGPPDSTGLYNMGGDGIRFSTATLLSPQERINGTVLGHFQVSNSARLFWEGWFSETHTAVPLNLGVFDTALDAPAGTVSGNLIISVDNPFLSVADRALIAQNLAAYAAIPGNPTQTDHFYLARNDQDLQSTTTANQITQRAVVGIDGTLPTPFDDDLNYELSANYGVTESIRHTPAIDFQNYTNALNAVAGPNDTIVCAPGYVNSPVPTQSATCAPFNPFGFGIASHAAVNYVTHLAQATSTLTQRDILATANGDLFTLPAGRAKISVGYENRLESADFEPDQFYLQGLGYSVPYQSVRGSFRTNEVFGEVLIPVISPIQVIPGAHRLELEGAAREVDHSVAGKALTWTAGLRWEPASLLQFRGNYTRSIRAPSVTEAFLATSEAFDVALDPCDKSLINSGPVPAVRAANCARAGLAQPFASNIFNFGGPVTVSGDPSLQNEIAYSRTFGVTLRPLPKMTLAIDYVSIDIERVITNLSSTNVLDACYDDTNYPSADCTRITRAPDGQITRIQTGYANQGFEDFNGITLRFEYGFDIPAPAPGEFGHLDIALNHFFENYLNQAVGTEDVMAIAGTIGNSKQRGNIDFTWTKERFYALWQTRYVGRATFDNALPATNSLYTGVATWWVNNLTLAVAPTRNCRIQLVADNIFDKRPPYPFPAVPPNSQFQGNAGISTYYAGILGRYFLLSASYNFNPF